MRKIKTLILIILSSFSAFAQNIRYTSGDNSWNSDSLGNHRAVVTFNGSGKFAKAIIEWRRRDDNPQDKRIIVQ
ncbi:MAG: glycoside hydrolase domain-containing protein, partial [Bacteroidota bacterium]